MSQIKRNAPAAGDESAPSTYEKPQAKAGHDPFAPKVNAEVQSTKLKQMLAGLKSNKDI